MIIVMDREAWNRLQAFPRDNVNDPRSVMSLIRETVGKDATIVFGDVKTLAARLP